MKLCIISDTHSKHAVMKHEIPECDVLIHAGDFTGWESDKEWGHFVSWFLEQHGTHKLLIQGNHDKLNYVPTGRYHDTELVLLHDTAIVIRGLKFYGSPWTPEFFNWHWMLPRNGDEIAKKWAAIPDDTDVLITHGPAFGTLDDVHPRQHERAGCERLAERLEQLPDLKLHCFGHIHYSSGISYDGKSVNASICDEDYRPWNEPKLIEINA